ncbi:MAG TPA: hypothetical protein PLQ34_08965 [Ferrovaceae bacterium]|nr:hypothetical protein [Ferrovaceae bacterium]
MSWLEQIAPTIATALGGPLGGLAYEVVSKVLGVQPDEAKTMLETGKLSSDQIAQVKQAEIELKKTEETLGLDFASLAEKDRESARSMQATTKSWIPGFLAIFITAGFFGILIALMYGQVQKGNEIMIMLGSLGTAWAGVVTFYFGSSASSQSKDATIHNLSK